jgi:hypothetical protein
MAEITINAPEGAFKVKIKGDTPTAAEQFKINEIIANRRREARRAAFEGRRSEQEDPEFDTESGIELAGLRANLSTAENASEEDAQLKQLYGLSEGDFTRDKRGRLAITPSGGKKLGLDLQKSTLIDESGFSRYDFADLFGIVPEIGGSVYGAIAGAPFGPAGIIGGSVLGAMTGAATEEAIEGIAGVSEQTAGEIAKDIAVEGGITLAADVTFGAAGALFRAGRKGLSVKDLPEDDLRAAGESLTYQITKPDGTVENVPITPELAAIGAPSVIARQAKITERILGTSDRLKANYDNMQKIMGNFRERLRFTGAVDAEDIGDLALENVARADATLKATEKEARDAVVKEMDSIINQFTNAAVRGADVDEDAFKILADTVNNFDYLAGKEFEKVQALVGEVVGSKEFIPTARLQAISKRIVRENQAAIAASRGTAVPRADDPNAALLAIVDGIAGLGKKDTGFLQLYNLRKTLNDGKIYSRSGTADRELENVISQIDDMLSAQNIEAYAKAAGRAIDSDGLQKLTAASDSLNAARGYFQRGQTAIDDLQDAIKIKDLADRAKSGTIPPNADFLTSLIKSGKPQPLKRALTVVKKYGKKGDADRLRETLATTWLDNAFKSSLPEGIEGGMFSGKGFAKSIDGLGKTADELFGDQASSIRALARQIDQTSTSNMTEEMILRAVSQGLDPKAPLASMMRAVRTAQQDLNQFTSTRALRELNSGNLTAIHAAEYITNPNAQPESVRAMMNFFRDKGENQALEKIQAFYMNNVLRDFGADTFIDGKAIKDFSKNFNKAGEGGKFRVIFGDEMGAEMEKFGRVLAINAKTAQGGDLVAANIAASPLQNLGKIAKFTVIGNFLRSAPYYKQVIDQYELATKGAPPEKKAKILGQIIGQALSQTPGQVLQEGVNEASSQLEAVMESSGLNEQLSEIQSRMQPPTTSSGIGQVDVTQPLSPNVAPVGGTQPNLRQLAAADPAVADALGIRGATAGLLTS